MITAAANADAVSPPMIFTGATPSVSCDWMEAFAALAIADVAAVIIAKKARRVRYLQAVDIATLARRSMEVLHVGSGRGRPRG
jgi:hypothetical protein